MTLCDCEHALAAIRDLSVDELVAMHTLLAALEARERRTAARDALVAERDVLRAALVRIANAESGIWGTIAHSALKDAA